MIRSPDRCECRATSTIFLRGCSAVAGEIDAPKDATLCERLLVCIKAKIFAQVSKRILELNRGGGGTILIAPGGHPSHSPSRPENFSQDAAKKRRPSILKSLQLCRVHVLIFQDALLMHTTLRT